MPSRLPPFCLAAALALSAGLPVFGAVASTPPGGQAAVLFDPRMTRAELAEAAARAGASIVRFGAAPGSIVVELPDSGGSGALRAAGAWLVADPIILGGCASANLANGDPKP
ncbi:MAG: hypothetical protein RKE49_03260 [Oceanicaulis sp.]